MAAKPRVPNYQKVLKYLESGRPLTKELAAKKLGVEDLAGAIRDLRYKKDPLNPKRALYTIDTDLVTRKGHARKIAEYRLVSRQPR